MKTALVTGGGSGIGAAVAHRLRTDGYNVATIDLNPSDADYSYTADITDRDQIGKEVFRRFANLTFDQWRTIIDINLHGVFHATQAVLPDMVEAGWGRIVNISSSSTHSGAPFMSAYVAAKSGVNGLTKNLALEYGPAGITVNAVPPGFIDTPMLRNSASQGNLGSIDEAIKRTPVGRMGKPEDIAAACAFFVSEEAGYITGQILGVNGGRNT